MLKPITRKEWNKLNQRVKDALKQASNHDPELVQWLRAIDKRLVIVLKALNTVEHKLELDEHRLDRVGAPQYRTVYGPKPKIQLSETILFAPRTKKGRS